LKFARDSQWKFYVSVASTFDNTNAITVSYESSLEGCEYSSDWFWHKFLEELQGDNMLGLPIASRVGVSFSAKCYIGDFHIHVLLLEEGAETTECDGPPCYFVYAPRAVMKFRAEDFTSVERMITMCYNEVPQWGEQLHGKFWALIGEINGGQISPQCYLKLQGTHAPEIVHKYNQTTFENGLESAPYRTGIGKFAAQFKPEKPFAATMAIETGIHGEHAIAILFEQKTRRCLLSERCLLTSDVDTFWRAMKLWAEFDPRAAKTRTQAGQLYYPAVYSHMVEQYWDFLHAPTHEQAGDDQDMGKYVSAAARLTFSENMLVDAEAPEHSLKVASAGAMSRRYPIQDAQDYWSSPQDQAQEEAEAMREGFKGVDRSSPSTDGSASSPGGSIVGTGLGAGAGSTDTCATSRRPSYTGDAFSLEG
jgi:hypothetical protein